VAILRQSKSKQQADQMQAQNRHENETKMGNISQSPISAKEVQVEVDAAIEAVEKHLQVLNRTV
jgi:hypothetical protein